MKRSQYLREHKRNVFRKYPGAVIRRVPSRQDTADIILQDVCRHYGVDVHHVSQMNRSREVPYPEIRQVAMTLFMDKLKMSSREAGEVFFKDHATALWARKKIRGYRKIDKKFKQFTDPLFS